MLSELPMQQSAITRALVVLDDPERERAGSRDRVGVRPGAVRAGAPTRELCALRNVGPRHQRRSGGRDPRIDDHADTRRQRRVGQCSAGPTISRPASGTTPCRSRPRRRSGPGCARSRGATRSAPGSSTTSAPRLLYRFDHDNCASRIAAGPERSDRLLDDENDAYGADHAVIGAEALAAWNLPPAIVDALRTHHSDPHQLTGKLGRVLILGEALARAAFDLPTFDHEPAEEPEDVFAALGLTVASVDTFVDRTAEETETLAGLLGIS